MEGWSDALAFAHTRSHVQHAHSVLDFSTSVEGVTAMLVNFHQMPERTVSGMNGGTGQISAKMFLDSHGKVICCRIHVGGSIGTHRHETSDDINYVLSGNGKAVCDGKEEILTAGCCHICKKGSEHSIVKTGSEDLCLLTVVAER